MANLFSSADRAILKRPHVARAFFLEIDLPSNGLTRFHNGVGTVTVDGKEWKGVTDPLGRQMVGIGQIDETRFGQASAVEIVLSGVDSAFMKSVRDDAAAIEGRRADMYFSVFDAETYETLMFRKILPGFLSSPKLFWQGIGIRTISFTIEGFFQAKNFVFGGKWSPAGQRKRYSGDKGLDFMGVDIKENRR